MTSPNRSPLTDCATEQKIRIVSGVGVNSKKRVSSNHLVIYHDNSTTHLSIHIQISIQRMIYNSVMDMQNI